MCQNNPTVFASNPFRVVFVVRRASSRVCCLRCFLTISQAQHSHQSDYCLTAEELSQLFCNMEEDYVMEDVDDSVDSESDGVNSDTNRDEGADGVFNIPEAFTMRFPSGASIANLDTSSYVTIKYSEIPEYLHSTPFYAGLDDEEDSFQLCTCHYKPKTDVLCLYDLAHLFSTMKFWGVEDIPFSAFSYCRDNRHTYWIPEFITLLGEETAWLVNAALVHGTIAAAMATTRRDVVRFWMLNNDPDMDETGKACHLAAASGDLEKLMELHANEYPWDVRTVLVAARSQSLTCLQYALENGCPCDTACWAAVKIRDLTLLKVLREHFVPWDEEVTDMAVSNADLDCLRYLFENGCPYNPDIVLQMSKCLTTDKGVQPCLQYLIEEQGMFMDENVFSECLAFADFASVQFLVDYGCSCHFVAPTDLLTMTLPEQDEDMLQCLKYVAEHGFELNAALREYVRTCEIPLCHEYMFSGEAQGGRGMIYRHARYRINQAQQYLNDPNYVDENSINACDALSRSNYR